jgi:hypothetical protein
MNGENALPVCADDFASTPNRTIFNRVSGLTNRGLLAVTDALRATANWRIGGAGHITEIATLPHDQENLNYRWIKCWSTHARQAANQPADAQRRDRSR